MLHVNFTSPFAVLGKLNNSLILCLSLKPGSDPEEKYLPSKLENPEKRSHNIPFSPMVKLHKTLESRYFVRNAKGPDLCTVNGN